MNTAAFQLTSGQLTFHFKSLARADFMSFNDRPFLFGGYFSYILRNNTYKKNRIKSHENYYPGFQIPNDLQPDSLSLPKATIWKELEGTDNIAELRISPIRIC